MVPHGLGRAGESPLSGGRRESGRDGESVFRRRPEARPARRVRGHEFGEVAGLTDSSTLYCAGNYSIQPTCTDI